MLKIYNFDIVCQEIPDEITLALNISGCPNRCPGCHSPWLQQDIGEILNEQTLSDIVEKYIGGITCVCFMGGDADPQEVTRLACFIRNKYPHIKTGWYSGCDSPVSADKLSGVLDYIKTGSYIEKLGGLKSPGTNQKLFKIEKGHFLPIFV